MASKTVRAGAGLPLLLVGLLAAPVTSAAAQGFSATAVQWLHGNGYALGPERADILTFEHASAWALGSNYFFFDVTEPFDTATTVYGEWYSRLAWSSIGLTHQGSGLVKDVSFAASINAGHRFRAYLAGLTVHLRLPGFAFFDIDVMAYDERSDAETTYILTPAWELPFALGKAAGRFRGFVDVIGAEGARAAQVLAQPQLLFDVGSWWGRRNGLFFGIEYQYWRNKYGLEGATESLPQLLAVWQF